MMKLTKSSLIGLLTLIMGLTFVWSGCKHEPLNPEEPLPPGPVDCDTSNVTFNGSVLPIFQANGPNPYYGLDLTNFDHLAAIVKNGSLIGSVKHAEGFYPMPKAGAKLSDCDIKLIEIWANDTSFNDVSCDTNNVTYNGTVLPILKAKCFSCHSGPTPQGNLDFNNYAHVAFVAESGTLLGALNHESGYSPMPKNGAPLDDCSISQIEI